MNEDIYRLVQVFLGMVKHRKPSWIHRDSLEAIKGMDDWMIRDIAEGATPMIRVKSVKHPGEWTLTALTSKKLLIGGGLMLGHLNEENLSPDDFINLFGTDGAEDILIQLCLLGDVCWHSNGKRLKD